MNTETAKFRITFAELSLATSPGNRELMTTYKQPADLPAAKKAEELAALPSKEEVNGEIEKASTVFTKNETGIFAWDYQLRGFFKEALASLIELGECDISKWSYKRAVDQFAFVTPRCIYYRDAAGAILKQPVGALERPLRATTMQGDRVCLARSEYVPAGTTIEFAVTVQTTTNTKNKVARVDMDLIRACLDRGAFVGFSQWRSGSYGRFTWTEITDAK